MSKLRSSFGESSIVSCISQFHLCCGFKSHILGLSGITFKAAWGWGDGNGEVRKAGSAWKPGPCSQPSNPLRSKVLPPTTHSQHHTTFFPPLLNSRFFEHRNNVFSSTAKPWVLGRDCRFLRHNEDSISVHCTVHDWPNRIFPKIVFRYCVRISCIHRIHIMHFGQVHSPFLALHFPLYPFTVALFQLHVFFSFVIQWVHSVHDICTQV